MTSIGKCLPKLFHTLFIRKTLAREKITFTKLPSFCGAWPMLINKGQFTLGENCSFRSFRIQTCVTVMKGGKIEIGDHTFINDGVNICSQESIIIGKHVKIADLCTIYDTDFHQISKNDPVRKKPVVIHDNAWIGASSIILAGSEIGKNSVIAAGSVVSGKIPENCVAAGIPAKPIRFFDEEKDWIRP